jgi:hypothetical protein
VHEDLPFEEQPAEGLILYDDENREPMARSVASYADVADGHAPGAPRLRRPLSAVRAEEASDRARGRRMERGGVGSNEEVRN